MNRFVNDLILVPGGCFDQGASKEEIELNFKEYQHLFTERDTALSWFYKSYPKLRTYVDSFHVSKHLVTNEQYHNFLTKTKLYPSQKKTIDKLIEKKRFHPVKYVLFHQAELYCKWISEESAHPFRLMTEAEYEYLASNGGRTKYPFGDIITKMHVNTLETGVGDTLEIGSQPSGNNELGVAELCGQVEEWTSSNYHPYPGGKLIKDRLYDYAGGPYPVLRGGAYNLNFDLCLSWRRHGYFPDYTITGFRVCSSA